MKKFVSLNARKGNDFVCVSNLSVYGSLIPGIDAAPTLAEATDAVYREAEILKSQGYKTVVEVEQLYAADFRMLKEFNAI